MLQAAGRYDEAIELAASAVETAKGAEQRLTRLAVLRDAYRRADRLDEMVETGKEEVAEIRKLLVEAQPKQQPLVEAYLFEQRRTLASLLTLAERYEEAIANLRQMLDQVTQLRQRVQEIGSQTQDAQLRLRAQASEQQALQRQIFLLRGLSYVYQSQEDRETALGQMRQAYELMPDDVGLNNDYGYMLADMTRDLPNAERMIRLAVADQPTQAAYLDSLAWVLYKRGQFAEALTWMQRAIALVDRRDPAMYDHLADILWRLDRREQAIDAWRQSRQAHERRIATGQAEGGRAELDRVIAKLEAIEKGAQPEVAEIAAETRPAP